jgi:hypothetical protein
LEGIKMKNRGFVFSTIGFLLIIPAVVLSASFIHMLKTGSQAPSMVMASDTVFFVYEDIAQDLCKINTSEVTVSQYMGYAENNLSKNVGVNISIDQITNSTFNVTVKDLYSNITKTGGLNLNVLCPGVAAAGDTVGPSIDPPQESADPICQDGTGSPTNTTVNATTIRDNSNVSSATIHYKLPGGNWTSKPMSAVDGAFDSTVEDAEAPLGPATSTGSISYWIEANDTLGNIGLSNNGGNNYTITVQVCGAETIYYLHDDGSYDENDPDDLLNTTSPVNPSNTKYKPGNQDGMEIEKKTFDLSAPKSYQRWESNTFSVDTTINGDVKIYLWMRMKVANKKGIINVTLYEDGAPNTFIANATEDNGCADWSNSYGEVLITMPSVSYTITAGNKLVLFVNAPDNLPCTTEDSFYFHYDTDTYNSRILIPIS